LCSGRHADGNTERERNRQTGAPEGDEILTDSISAVATSRRGIAEIAGAARIWHDYVGRSSIGALVRRSGWAPGSQVLIAMWHSTAVGDVRDLAGQELALLTWTVRRVGDEPD
jgi:hypothetical protein